jgi:hypothetical protein
MTIFRVFLARIHSELLNLQCTLPLLEDETVGEREKKKKKIGKKKLVYEYLFPPISSVEQKNMLLEEVTSRVRNTVLVTQHFA